MKDKLRITQSKNTRVWITGLKELSESEKTLLVEKIKGMGAFVEKRFNFSIPLAERLKDIKFDGEHVVIYYDEKVGWRAVVSKFQRNYEDVGGTCFSAKNFLSEECDTIVTLGE